MEECAELARKAASEMWRRNRVPCYLYEAAARSGERRKLEAVRKGQFERLRDAVKEDPTRRPDVGGPELHPTAGATAGGAQVSDRLERVAEN